MWKNIQEARGSCTKVAASNLEGSTSEREDREEVERNRRVSILQPKSYIQVLALNAKDLVSCNWIARRRICYMNKRRDSKNKIQDECSIAMQ